ncbi:hypothetical protein AAVH_16097 [Aphelenchoides avenae]|nr:hypothetical protein AAVH_16097 [Aphelenchus avenae]
MTSPSAAEVPSRQCSGPRVPPGGFGPLTGLEEEAPEDPETSAAEEVRQQDSFAPIATRTRRRIATTKLVHWPQVLFNPGTMAQQTYRDGLHEEDSVRSA